MTFATNEGESLDFTRLGPFKHGDVSLSRREHQVVAMYAYGFCDDNLIADTLSIATKQVQGTKYALRKRLALSGTDAIARLYRSIAGDDPLIWFANCNHEQGDKRRRSNRKEYDPADIRVWYEEYKTENLPLAEIASRHGISPARLSHEFKVMGLVIRWKGSGVRLNEDGEAVVPLPEQARCNRCQIGIANDAEEAAALGVRFLPTINLRVGDICIGCAEEGAGRPDENKKLKEVKTMIAHRDAKPEEKNILNETSKATPIPANSAPKNAKGGGRLMRPPFSQLEEKGQEQPSPVIMTELEAIPNEAATKELVDGPRPKNEAGPRGMHIDTEEALLLTAEEMLGWAIAVLGIRGSGKSNTAAVIAEELLAAGVPLMVVDIAGEYHTLRDEFSHVTVIGRSLTCAVDIEADKDNARALAEKIYTHGESVIFDLSAVPSDQRADLLNEFFSTVWELSPLHRSPYFIFLEEAQNWIPQRGKTPVSQVFRDMASEGRKRGLSLVMVSLRSAGLDKAVLSQADLMFLHRVRHPRDVAVYTEMIPRQKRWVEEKVNKLRQGQALVLIKDQVLVASIRLRRTEHVGYTPTLANVPIEPVANGDRPKAMAVAMLEPETSINGAAVLNDTKVREIYAEYIATDVTVEGLARKHNLDTATLATRFAKIVHSRKGIALSLSDANVREIYAEYIAGDQTINELAKKHNTNTATLSRRFAALGLKARKGRVSRLSDDTIRAIHAEHIGTGLSAGKLSGKYHVSRPTLVGRFRDLGLEYPWQDGSGCVSAEIAPERIAALDTRLPSEQSTAILRTGLNRFLSHEASSAGAQAQEMETTVSFTPAQETAEIAIPKPEQYLPYDYEILRALIDKLPPDRRWTRAEKSKWVLAFESVVELEIVEVNHD